MCEKDCGYCPAITELNGSQFCESQNMYIENIVHFVNGRYEIHGIEYDSIDTLCDDTGYHYHEIRVVGGAHV